MLKYAEDFKYNPSLRNKVAELRLAVEQEGEEEMLAMVDLDQWYVLTWMHKDTHTHTHVRAHTHTIMANLFHFIVFKCISLNTVRM